MNLPILECRNLSKSYGQSDLALNNFNIVLPKGKVIGLLGPNGLRYKLKKLSFTSLR